MRRTTISIVTLALAAVAAFAGSLPASAALPDCMGGSGPNTRLVNTVTLALHDCAFHGISSAGVNGGTINNTGTLTLTNVTISGSRVTGANRDGGAIYNSGAGILNLNNVTLDGQGGASSLNATQNGGAIFNSGTVNANGLTVVNTATGNQGGAIYTEGTFHVNGPVNLGAVGTGNWAGNQGGGLANNGTVDGTGVLTVAGNTASAALGNGIGGGILQNSSTFNLARVVVKGNHAGSNGGGIFSYDTMSLSNSTVQDNRADSEGGGIFNNGCTLTLTGSAVTGNASGGAGGGVLDSGGCTLDFANDTISGNSAGTDGGGIALQNGFLEGPSTISSTPSARPRAARPREVGISPAPNLTLSANTAGRNGGGLFAGCAFESQSRGAMLHPTIADNTAKLGGGIWVEPADGCGSLIEVEAALLARNAPSNCAGGNVAELGGVNSANLDTGNSCKFTLPSDKVNVADPGLAPAPPADNFGPVPTQALLFGSVAIDAQPGGCPPPATDARGTTRPQAATCDIGAYECIGAAPTVTQVTPGMGDKAGGTVVTITGNNFDRPAKVTFGGVAAANMVVTSATSITATTPPGSAAGRVDVVVQTCRANSPASAVDGFMFTATPTLPKAGSPRTLATPSAGLLLLDLLTCVLALVLVGRRGIRARRRG